MAVRISLGRPFGPRAGGRGGRTASGRATNEKLQRISDPHGAQADKDTPKTGDKGPGNEEARTNGPIKCDRGLTGTVPPALPPPHPQLYRAQEGHGQTLPLGGRNGGMGGARAYRPTRSEGRGVLQGEGHAEWGRRHAS